MTRPSFEEIFIKMAGLVAHRSTCKRLQVGCVIVTPDFRTVLSMGYNGNASGLPNTCDSEEPGKCGCIHAEQNAVINCDAPRYVDKIIFCTHLPCVMCAKFMINLGNVKEVVYRTDYRLKDALMVLDAADIPHRQYKCVHRFVRSAAADPRSRFAICQGCGMGDADLPLEEFREFWGMGDGS